MSDVMRECVPCRRFPRWLVSAAVVTGGACVGCVGGLVVTGGAFVGGFWARLPCFVLSMMPAVSRGRVRALAVVPVVSRGVGVGRLGETGGAFVGCVGGLVVTGGAFVGGFWAKLRCSVLSMVPAVSRGRVRALAVASPVSCGRVRALAVVRVVSMLSPWFFWVSII